jgi:hypothetical protein
VGRIGRGVIAGATGTMALNAATYLDMAIRGRPSSDLPGRAVSSLAADAGIDLTGEGEAAANRREALGALAGMATGVGVAVVCSTLVPRLGRRRLLVPAAVVGGMAALGANAPMVAKGLTDPAEWGPAGWASDLIPHLAYGLGVVATLRALRHEPWRVTGEVLARVDGVAPLVVQ